MITSEWHCRRITYSPSMLSDLKLIAEYDSHDILIGMNYLLFHHFLVQAMMQKGNISPADLHI